MCEVIMKMCSCCKQEKPITEFTKDKRSKDGHFRECRECKNRKMRERYERIKDDPEYQRKKHLASKKYKEEHREEIRIKAMEYNNRPEVIERKANWYQNKQANKSLEERLKETLARVKKRSKDKAVPFNLTLEDLYEAYSEKCPILDIELNWYNPQNEGGRAEDTPALDRIDPKEGYVKGNVRFISTLANMMKSSATRLQLEVFCKNIFNYLDSKDIVRTVEKVESTEQGDKELLG